MRIIFNKDEYQKFESGSYGNTDKTTYEFTYCPVEAGYNHNVLQVDNWMFCSDPNRSRNEEPKRIIFARNIIHEIDEQENLVVTVLNSEWHNKA